MIRRLNIIWVKFIWQIHDNNGCAPLLIAITQDHLLQTSWIESQEVWDELHVGMLQKNDVFGKKVRWIAQKPDAPTSFSQMRFLWGCDPDFMRFTHCQQIHILRKQLVLVVTLFTGIFLKLFYWVLKGSIYICNVCILNNAPLLWC